jgi:hypothetical protein
MSRRAFFLPFPIGTFLFQASSLDVCEWLVKNVSIGHKLHPRKRVFFCERKQEYFVTVNFSGVPRSKLWKR